MVAERSTPGPVQPLETISLEELLTATYEPLHWIIPDILPEGLTLFFADAKLGKSMVSLALMLRMIRNLIADGSVQGDVLYLSKDDRNKRRLQSRIRSLLGGVPLEHTGHTAYFAFRSETLSTGLLGQLDAWLREKPATRLIVVDVYASIKARKSGEDVFSGDYDALEELRDFAERRHISILLLHHTNKRSRSGGGDGDWTKDVNGSTGLLAACDTFWKLEGEPRTNVKTLRCKGRDVEECALRVDLDDLEGEWPEIDADERSVTSVTETQILELFVTLVTLTPKLIEQHTSIKPATARKLLRRLLAKGLVEQTAYGAYGQVSVTSVTSETDTVVTLPPAPIPFRQPDPRARLLKLREQLQAEILKPGNARGPRHEQILRLLESNKRLLEGLEGDEKRQE